MKPQLPEDVPIIAQPHVAGPDLKKWVALCKLMEEAGADAIELNLWPCFLSHDLSNQRRLLKSTKYSL